MFEGLRIIEDQSGSTILVKVITRSARDKFVGIENGSLKIKIHALPVEGAANEALIDFLSERLGRPKKDIEIIKGLRSRHKSVHLKGMKSEEVLKVLIGN
jgi:hypothetical protein